MEFLTATFSEYTINDWSVLLDNWFYIASLAFLAVEVLRLLIKRGLTWNIVADGIANFITLYAFIGLYYVLLGAFYVSIYYFVFENFRVTTIPISAWSICLCVVLADFAYYWEHRFTHRVGIAWLSHTVHHSSPYFNISVAYRFGPLDGVYPVLFSIPLAIAGFNPLLIFFSEALVQLYQTPLHTQLIGKLPKPIEAVFNTPSHHRVHHGKNPQYLDKNYGGIFIVWDKLFGTFAEERETVEFGIKPALRSVNPLVVFFHGFFRFGRKLKTARNASEVIGHCFRPPDWNPRFNDSKSSLDDVTKHSTS